MSIHLRHRPPVTCLEPAAGVGLAVLACSLAAGAVAAAAFDLEPEANLSESESPSSLNEVSPQALAVDAAGRAFVVWSEFAGEGDQPVPELVLRQRRLDGGWSSRVQLTPADGRYSSDAAVAAGPDGRVHVVWVDQGSGAFEVRVAVLDPEAGRLTAAETVSAPAQLMIEPAIAAGPGGELAVGWTAMEGMNYELRLRVRPAGGAFGPIEVVTAADRRASDQLALAYGPDGRLHLAWADNRTGVRRILYAVRAAGRLGAPVEVSPDPGRGKQTRPVLAVEGRDRVAIAWQDARTGTDTVYLAQAGTGNAPRFGAPLAVAKHLSRSPSLAALPGGGLAIGWEDGRRETLVEEASVQIMIARVARGEVIDPRAVTSDRPVSCFNPCLAADASGAVHLVWRNAGFGEGEIMYRRTRPPGGGGSAGP
jgi:hypothetical protein